MKLWHFSSLAVLALAGCSSPPPEQNFTPLEYSYLPPLVLKVANLNIVNDYVPSPDTVVLLAQDPAPPATTLLAMLNHRVVASGAPGTGTVTIQNAAVHEVAGTLTGTMTVDVNVSSPDGHSTGYAEATVSASRTAPDADAPQGDMEAALYYLTKQLMDDMNVQLQYQMQHNLSGWLSWSGAPGGAAAYPTAAPAGGTIQATPLTTPSGAASAPAPAPVPAPPTAGSPEPEQNLVPPGYPGGGPRS
ncbi:hypothetical protein [Acidocella sp.]|uniref:hypothetical protein n=1 Tax=Acidocella sp. TaxID=50710 RepID=UPI002F3F0B1A